MIATGVSGQRCRCSAGPSISPSAERTVWVLPRWAATARRAQLNAATAGAGTVDLSAAQAPSDSTLITVSNLPGTGSRRAAQAPLPVRSRSQALRRQPLATQQREPRESSPSEDAVLADLLAGLSLSSADKPTSPSAALGVTLTARPSQSGRTEAHVEDIGGSPSSSGSATTSNGSAAERPRLFARPSADAPQQGNGTGLPPGPAVADLSHLADRPWDLNRRRRTSPPTFSDVDPDVAAAYDDLPVTVRGREPPPPLLSYNDMRTRGWRVSSLLLRNLEAAFRLRRPTPVQSHVIPAVMEGRDVVAVSCTGSGKTLAYLLPLLAQLMNRSRTGPKNFAYPDALVLVPTRELAEQLYADVQVLTRGSHIKALKVHGGVSVAEQVLAIRGPRKRSAGGADLVIATPGRLLQLVEQRQSVMLSRVGLMVVDEADVMLDLGMWPDLRRLLSHPTLPTARQTVMVSAALPAAQVQQIQQLLRDQVEVVMGDEAGTTVAVRQTVEQLAEEDKLDRLAELLAPRAASGVAGTSAASGSTPTSTSAPQRARPPASPGASTASGSAEGPGGPAVVFVNSLARAEAVARHLASRGASVALLHRELSQDQRDEAMQCFRFGVASVLVATSLASRGLNFPDVALVINFDVPYTLSDHVHQVGRTGRGGRPGRATTFVTTANRAAAPWLADALRRSGSVVPPWLDALSRQAAETDARKARWEGHRRAGAQTTAASGERNRGTRGSEVAREEGRGFRPQLQGPVSLDHPAAAGTMRFGAYLRRPSAADGADAEAAELLGTTGTTGAGPAVSGAGPAASSGESSSASAEGGPDALWSRQGRSQPPLSGGDLAGAGVGAAASAVDGGLAAARAAPVAPVLDRKHDSEYWMAVFNAALRPVHKPRPESNEEGGDPERQQQQRRRKRSKGKLSAAPSPSVGPSVDARDDEHELEDVAPGRKAAVAPAEGRPGRGSSGGLLYEDGAVRLEAEPWGGITAGAGAGRRVRG